MQTVKLNKQELDILRCLKHKEFTTQRVLSVDSGYSLGTVNKSLKFLKAENYIDVNCQLTDKALSLFERNKPIRAVILAAGFGMRMVPINMTTPKALLEVKGEILIERLIRQLHEVGINDISIVVGFMKESFEYLSDKFGVELIVNNMYSSKNNLYSVGLCLDRLSNCYIIPCDIWCEINPFNRDELYSWYMISDGLDRNSYVRVNRKQIIESYKSEHEGMRMIGISYLLADDSCIVADKMISMLSDTRFDDSFWEDALFDSEHRFIYARIVKDSVVKEINTYEQLRDIDSESNHLKSEAINTIASTFNCNLNDIKEIMVLKKGMTNRSFLFSINGFKYIMRIPGEGTDQLINRKQEADVYDAISGLGLCDDPVYINPSNGYKITKYLEGIRACDPYNDNDVKLCMKKLKSFHNMKLKVNHSFDIFSQISFYESLWNGYPSAYTDYNETKSNVLSLRDIIDGMEKICCLTHIDAVPDNFLFYKPENSLKENLQLTDWEYSGMQDPHVDLAMFCIYSLYDKDQCDHLIDVYFDGKCSDLVRGKIYCYISACGLLWSNWCEYKRHLGVEFGEYSLRQYRYAKEFYRYAVEIL